MKLSTGLENFKGVASYDLSFVSVEIDKNYWLALPRWGNLCHRLSCDQPQPGSFFQRPREAEKRDPGNEVGLFSVILETTILSNTIMLLPARHLVSELDWTAEMFAACLVQFRQVLRWPIIFELSGNVVQQRHEEKCCIPIRPV